MIASAVVVPKAAEDDVEYQGRPPKRRLSPSSMDGENSPKHSKHHDDEQIRKSPPSPSNNATETRKKTHVDERKRGRRLFGALVGTLSQSSSSTAHKRRADIEKKQQEKLKLQSEEHDEERKQRADALNARRRREHERFCKQSVGAARELHWHYRSRTHFILDGHTTLEYACCCALSENQGGTEACLTPFSITW